MTETKTNRLIPITPEDVQAFMESKNVDSSCPRCSVGSWIVHEKPDERGVGVFTITDNGELPIGKFFPLLYLQCNNCANIWFVARVPVQEWLTERKSNAER